MTARRLLLAAVLSAVIAVLGAVGWAMDSRDDGWRI